MDGTLALGAAATTVIAAAAALPKAWQRLELSLAKHRSLTGHSRWAQRVARWLPGYAYDEARFFACDGAPDDVAAQRRASLARLAALYLRSRTTTSWMTRPRRCLRISPRRSSGTTAV